MMKDKAKRKFAESWLKQRGWILEVDGIYIDHSILCDYANDGTYFQKSQIDEVVKKVDFWYHDEYEDTVYEDIWEAVEFEEELKDADFEKAFKNQS